MSRAKDKREEKRKAQLGQTCHRRPTDNSARGPRRRGQRDKHSTYWPAVPQHAAGATLRLKRPLSPIAHHVVFSPRTTITPRSQLPPMNTDIHSLRAELKAFEREFKAAHHRPPSVDDIRNAGFGATRLHQNLTPKRILGSSLPPSTADKYRLYKRLSKLGNATRSLPENSHLPPSTPPRSITQQQSEIPISIIPRSRAVKTETASTSNPFSPAKNKQNKLAPVSLCGSDGSSNPFATPQKARQSLIFPPKSVSPDPFPSVQALNDTTCPSRTSLPNNTVSRARKRLRGDPVSPSPVKEKRPRVLPNALPFAKLSTHDMEDSDDDDDDRAAAEQADFSFVVDSPMKPPPKGGAFKLLFEGAAGDVNSQDVRVRSQEVPANTGLGISRSKSQRATSMPKYSTSETLTDNHQNLKMNASEGNSTKDSAKSRTTKRLYPNHFCKKDFFGAAQPSKAPLPEPEQAKQAVHIEECPQRSTAAKRSLADTDSDTPDSLCPNHRPLLLPPSPPPAASGSVYTGKGKGRGQATGPARKRPKLPEDSGDDDEGSTNVHVKIREWGWQRCGTSRATSEEDLDPILGLGAYDRLSSPSPVSDDAPGDFEVDLPDHLRCLLAISPSKALTTRDVSVVRGVLYGERTSSYDAQRGGDIWDVGEIGEAGDSQAEDEWEGEPVPWETGEL